MFVRGASAPLYGGLRGGFVRVGEDAGPENVGCLRAVVRALLQQPLLATFDTSGGAAWYNARHWWSRQFFVHSITNMIAIQHCWGARLFGKVRRYVRNAKVGAGKARRPLLIGLLVVVVVVVVLEFAFVTMATTETGCNVCHAPRVKGRELASSPHADQSCRSCHAPGGVVGFLRQNVRAGSNLVSVVTRRQGSEVGIAFSPVCRACHAGDIAQTVTAAGVRMNHAAVVRVSYDCTFCHPAVAHVPPAGSTDSTDPHSLCGSTACHENVNSASGCGTCHVNPSIQATTSSHPAGWGTTHGLGDLSTCTTCHKPTECKKCHGVELPHDTGVFIYNHGKQAEEAGSACFACHEKRNCGTCHKVAMPHAAGYLQTHGKNAVDKGTEVCVNCHLESGCLRCHVRHLHIGVAPEIIQKLEKFGVTGETSAGSSSSSGSTGGSQ